MANHGYVLSGIDLDRLQSLVEEFNETILNGIFSIRRDGVYIEMDHPDLEYLSILVLIGNFYHPETEENIPAIELRHHHHGQFHDIGWWLDHSLQNFLARKLNAKLADDGHDQIIDPKPEEDNFYEYLKIFHSGHWGWLSRRVGIMCMRQACQKVPRLRELTR